MEWINQISKNSNISLKIEFINRELLTYQQKMKLFKQANIENLNFEIYGLSKISENKIDNLISCLLNIVERRFQTYSISYSKSQIKIIDEDFLNRIQELQEENSITQSFVDHLINKICNSLNIRKDEQIRFILFKDLDQDLISEQVAVLYEEEENYVALMPRTKQIQLKDQAHKLINLLLHSEILQELCLAKYKQQTGLELEKLDFSQIFDAFKSLENEVEDNQDINVFLECISMLSKDNLEQRQIYNIITKLSHCYANSQEGADEYYSIQEGIQNLQRAYIDRLEITLKDETERRKREIGEYDLHKNFNNTEESLIKEQESQIQKLQNDMIEKDKEIICKQNEIKDMKSQLLKIPNYQQQYYQEVKMSIQNDEQDVVNQQLLLSLAQQNNQNVNQNFLNSLKKINDYQEIDQKLNKKKNFLVSKEKDIQLDLNQSLLQLNKLLLEKVELETKKQQIEKKIEEQHENEIEINLWTKFVEDIYNLFKGDQNLFTNRKRIFKNIKSAQTLIEMYEILIKETNLKQLNKLEIRGLAQKNEEKKRKQLISCLKKICQDPFLHEKIGDGKIEIKVEEINIVFEEVEVLLKELIQAKLKKYNFTMIQGKLATIHEEPKFEDYFNEKFDDDFTTLIDQKIKSTLPIEEKHLKQNGNLRNDTIINQFGELGKIQLSKLLEKFNISYDEILISFIKGIKLISGNNVYINTQKVNLFGLNLTIQAKNDIILPQKFILNVKGLNGQKFSKNNQIAFYRKVAAEKLRDGQNGNDGFDGFCGSNGGKIQIQASGQIKNLEFIEQIITSGGNGSQGQKGGFGQKGGVGQDTGDAEADDFGPCIFNPAFSIAFARIPGFDTDTSDFSKTSEFSGNGGNAGKAGFDGEGGFPGEILIKDRYNTVDKNIIVNEQGQTDDDAEIIEVKGGDSGEPGVYGCDHVIYVANLMERRQNKKGDYSNYLGYHFQGGNEQIVENDNQNWQNILENPDYFAQKSSSFTMVKLLTACASTFAALYFTTIIRGSLFSISAIQCTYQLVSGLKYTIGVPANKKQKNMAQINFDNRFCDKDPLRDEGDTNSHPRTDQRSRGKKGCDSQKKEESEREEHSKLQVSQNKIDNGIEMERINQSAINADSDAEKREVMKDLQIELQEKQNEIKQTQNQLNKIKVQNAQVIDNAQKQDLEVQQQEQNLKQIRDDIEGIQNYMKMNQQNILDGQNDLVNFQQQFLNSYEKVIKIQTNIDFLKIDIKGKHELVFKLNQLSNQIAQELEQQMSIYKFDLQQLITNKNQNQKSIEEKQQQIDKLRLQNLILMENIFKNEKHQHEIQELHRKLKENKESKKKTEAQEEVQQVKEFQKSNNLNKNDKQSQKIPLNNFPKTQNQLCIKLYEKTFNSKPEKKQLNYYKEFEEILLKECRNASLEKDQMFGKLDFLKDFVDEEKIIQLLEKPSNKLLNDTYVEAMHNLLKNNLLQEKKENIKITNDNYLLFCGLDSHYQILQEEEQVEIQDNFSFTELEEKMILFFYEKNYLFGINKKTDYIKSLLKSYKKKIKQVLLFEHPISKIINGNANRFYQFLLLQIKNNIQKGKKKYLGTELSNIFEIIEIINSNLKKLNQKQILCNILQESIQYLNDEYYNDLEYFTKNLNELNNQMKHMSTYKKELFEEILQPMLLQVLIKELSISEYDTIYLELLQKTITTQDEKDDTLLEIQNRDNQKKTKGLCIEKFMQKYDIKEEKKGGNIFADILSNLMNN